MNTNHHTANNRKKKKKKLVLVDRSVDVLLSNVTTTTPSQQSLLASCSSSSSASKNINQIVTRSDRQELLHRLHGTSLIADACQLLFNYQNGSNPSIYAVACAIFHRFYSRVSLTEVDAWSSAMASIFVAAKIENAVLPIKHVVLVFTHLYRRRRLCLTNDQSLLNNQAVAISPLAKRLNVDEKKNVLRHAYPTYFTDSYDQWESALKSTEGMILRELGFTLHWVSDSLPHKFLLYIIRLITSSSNASDLSQPQTQALAQKSWNYCNDSCRLDLCNRYEAVMIACSAIYLASCDLSVPLILSPKPWWQAFVGEGKEVTLATICNAILALYDPEVSQLALTSYIPSLLQSPLSARSFNDPGSSLWNQVDRSESG